MIEIKKSNTDRWQQSGEESLFEEWQGQENQAGQPTEQMDTGYEKYGNSFMPREPGPVSPAERFQKRKKTILYRLVFLFGSLVIGLVILQETVFCLKTVYVEGNDEKSPKYITDTAGLVQGLNIFAVNEAEIRRNLSRDHTLELLGIQKEYPSTLYLFIRERKTVAVFQFNGIQYTMDEEGMVMTSSEGLDLPKDLPFVTGLSGVWATVGQRISTRDSRQIQAYQRFISEIYLQMYQAQISELNVSDPDNLYLITNEGTTVRLGNDEYARAKIGAVRTDMAYLRQLGKTRGVLDVSIPEDAKYMPDN